MEKTDQIDFLNWLYNRLHYKYSYEKDDTVLVSILSIIQDLEPKVFYTDITDNELDKILSKYYIDFNLDKCDNSIIGFDDEDRKKLRNHIINIVNDVVNKRIPNNEEILIKG
jgi:replicative superfamily II helicase